MSLFDVHLVLYRMKNDRAVLEAFRANPTEFLCGFALTPRERDALSSGDVETLWALGVHPLLLVPFSRLIGMPAQEYRRRLMPLAGIRAVASHPEREGSDG